MNYGKLELWSPEVGERMAREYATVIDEPSLTVQDQAEEADINVIMRRFGVTGVASQVSVPPSYGDFETVHDFRSALHLIQAAQESFMELPASMRNRFNGDPAEFLDWIEDPKRTRAELEEIGLVTKVVEQGPVKVEVVNKAPEGGTPANKS